MKTKKILFRLFNLIIVTFIVLNLVTTVTGLGGICKADDKNPFTSSNSIFENSSIMDLAGNGLLMLLCGIPLLILLGIKLLIIVGGLVGQLLMYGIYSGFEGSWNNWVTLEDIIFAGSENASKFLDVNFFDFSSGGDIAQSFRESVAKWYYILRLIAAAALLVILIYVGIRMALSTVGEEKAKYKEMFMDWVQSIALLFLLHYIIVFFLKINSAFVDGLAPQASNLSQDLFKTLIESVFVSAIGGIVAAIVFLLMVGQIFKFFILYVKRMITVGFLIMISPLITITYAIDKIGDGKAQALNAWMKELAYNILIQPFHCILFMAFYSTIIDTIQNNTFGIAPYVFVIFIMNFMGKAEEILKHIFHFEARHMSSMADAGQTYANFRGSFTTIGKNVTKGATAFKAAGGFDTLKSGIKERKAIDIAKTKTKANYKQLKRANDVSVKDMSYKEYLASESGKEYFERQKTTAMAMKSRTEMRREAKKKEKIQKAVKEKIDNDLGEGAYEELKNAVKDNRAATYTDKYGIRKTITKENAEKTLEETEEEVVYDSKKGKGSYRKDKREKEEAEKNATDFDTVMEPGKSKIQDALKPSASTHLDPSDNAGMQAVKNKTDYTDANGNKANFQEIKNQLNDSTISEEKKEKLREQINETYYNEERKGKSVPDYNVGKKAKEEQPDKTKTFNDNLSDAKRNPGKEFRNLHDNLTITGAKISKGFERFTNPTTDLGKVAKAAFEDSSRVVGAIVLGGITFGATDKMQDAISAGQFGYGLVDGVWENSTKTAVDDGIDKMNKLLQVLGKNHEETKKLIEEVKEQQALGNFKEMGKIQDDFKKSLASYLGDTTERNRLVANIQRDFIEDGKEIDIETYMEFIVENTERKDLVSSDADKIRNILQGFLDTMARAEVAKSITTAESTGMRSGTFGSKVEKGLRLKEASPSA